MVVVVDAFIGKGVQERVNNNTTLIEQSMNFNVSLHEHRTDQISRSIRYGSSILSRTRHRKVAALRVKHVQDESVLSSEATIVDNMQNTDLAPRDARHYRHKM